jgi:hypothetical protein
LPEGPTRGEPVGLICDSEAWPSDGNRGRRVARCGVSTTQRRTAGENGPPVPPDPSSCPVGRGGLTPVRARGGRFPLLVGSGSKRRLARRLPEHAGREYEAGRCPRFRPTAVVDTRAVQAGFCRFGLRDLGFSTVRDDPLHDRVELSPFREDCGPLDDCAAGGMSSAQSRHQGANRVVVHVPHGSPSSGRRVLCRRLRQ